MSTSLNAARRSEDLEAATKEVADVLVIGGWGHRGRCRARRGFAGTQDRAAGGARSGVRDFSVVQQARARRLAPPGQGDVALAHESAIERGILMTRTAPHLVRTLPMLFPLHDNAGHLIMTGLRAGNLLRQATRTRADVLPSPRRVPKHEALALVPGLRSEGLRGGLLGHDEQLVVTLARTASGYGTRIITRAPKSLRYKKTKRKRRTLSPAAGSRSGSGR